MSGEFGGVRPIVHTPFAASAGAPVAGRELRGLVEWLRGFELAGVVALGLAAEASALTDAERDTVVVDVVDAAAGWAVTVGIDGPTGEAAARARRAAELGASSLMVLPPPGPVTRNVLVRHFATVAEAGLPIVVQDSPQATGVELDAEALIALAATVPAVIAVKVEAPAAGPKVSRLAGQLDVVAGWGGLHYPDSLERGACGLMPGSDLAAAFAAVHRTWRAGDRAGAEAGYRALLPYLSYQSQSLELLILGAKLALVRAGIFGRGELRDPLARLDPQQADTLTRLGAELVAAGVPGWGGPS